MNRHGWDEFILEVMAAPELRTQVKSLSDKAAIVAFAKEQGFEISEADVERLNETKEGELSDAELETVAGGFFGSDWFGDSLHDSDMTFRKGQKGYEKELENRKQQLKTDGKSKA